MNPDDYIYCYANQLNGLMQKAFDIFCEKEGHRVWAKSTRWKHALDALKKAGFAETADEIKSQGWTIRYIKGIGFEHYCPSCSQI